jgi:hypothetical protein
MEGPAGNNDRLRAAETSRGKGSVGDCDLAPHNRARPKQYESMYAEFSRMQPGRLALPKFPESCSTRVMYRAVFTPKSICAECFTLIVVSLKWMGISVGLSRGTRQCKMTFAFDCQNEPDRSIAHVRIARSFLRHRSARNCIHQHKEVKTYQMQSCASACFLAIL